MSPASPFPFATALGRCLSVSFPKHYNAFEIWSGLANLLSLPLSLPPSLPRSLSLFLCADLCPQKLTPAVLHRDFLAFWFLPAESSRRRPKGRVSCPMPALGCVFGNDCILKESFGSHRVHRQVCFAPCLTGLMLVKAPGCPFVGQGGFLPLIGSTHPSMRSGLIHPSTEPLSSTVFHQNPECAHRSYFRDLPSLRLLTTHSPQSRVLTVLPSQTPSPLRHLRSV